MSWAFWCAAFAALLVLPMGRPCAAADALPSYCESLVADDARPYAPVRGQEYCEGFFVENTSTSRADVYLLGYTLGRFDFNKSTDRFVRLSVPSVSQIGTKTVRFAANMIGTYPLYRLDGQIGAGTVQWDLKRYVIPSAELIVENMVLRAWDPKSGDGSALLPVFAEPESRLGKAPGAPLLTLKSSIDLAELCWWIQFDGDPAPLEGPRIVGNRRSQPKAKIGLLRDHSIQVELPGDRAGWATVSFRTVLPSETVCSKGVAQFRIHVPARKEP
jgi:hypothetical protein